jgi:hypothetical protein
VHYARNLIGPLSFFLLLPFIVSANGGPDHEACRSYEDETPGRAYLDSIEEDWDIHGIPEAYRSSFLIALSAYPELKGVPIRIREGDLKTTMAARPVPASLLGPPRGRAYRILMDTLAPASEGKLFRDLPFDARIGIMAHEFAHILEYSQRSLGGMIRYGARYLVREERKGIEARTDRIAVDRGFGWQLLAFKRYIREEAELSPSYRSYKEQVYLSSRDLRDILETHPSYAPPSSAQR